MSIEPTPVQETALLKVFPIIIIIKSVNIKIEIPKPKLFIKACSLCCEAVSLGSTAILSSNVVDSGNCSLRILTIFLLSMLLFSNLNTAR